MVGVLVGVWALIVVLSVLNGFGNDLKQKIIHSTPNIVIERMEGDFVDYDRRCKQLLQVRGVTGCSPYVVNEVMISSSTNSAGLLLRGIRKESSRITRLAQQIKSGSFAHLFAPEKIKIPKPFFLPTRREILKETRLSPQEKREMLGPSRRGGLLQMERRQQAPRATPAPTSPRTTPTPEPSPATLPSGPGRRCVSPPPSPRRVAPSAPFPPKKDSGSPPRLPSSPTAQTPRQPLPSSAPSGAPSPPSQARDLSGKPLPAPPKIISELPPRPASAPTPPKTLTRRRKIDRRRYPGLLIGKELAQSLSVTVGDVVRLVSPIGGGLTPFGRAPRVRKFRIAGIFFSGMYEYDTKFGFATLRQTQRFFKMYESVSGLELSVRNVYQTGLIKQRVMATLGGYPYRVRDWIQMNSRLFAALQLEKVAMFVILTFIVLVASFNIISTLIMMVLEKARDIAILKSMGATRTGIMRIFMVEGVVIGLVGTAIGVLLGYRTCAILARYPIPMNTEVYYIATLPIQMNLSDVLVVALASLALSFLATIYPAQQAAELDPVEGLRYE